VKLVWDESAWDDYVWRQAQDRKILRRINALIRDVDRDGNEGIGKPERSTASTATGHGGSLTSTGSSTRSATTRSGSLPAGTTTEAGGMQSDEETEEAARRFEQLGCRGWTCRTGG
jgi:hypothetical protein